jgi:hypothetical protein
VCALLAVLALVVSAAGASAAQPQRAAGAEGTSAVTSAAGAERTIAVTSTARRPSPVRVRRRTRKAPRALPAAAGDRKVSRSRRRAQRARTMNMVG